MSRQLRLILALILILTLLSAGILWWMDAHQTSRNAPDAGHPQEEKAASSNRELQKPQSSMSPPEARSGAAGSGANVEITVMPIAGELSASLNREEESPEQNLQAVEEVINMFRRGFGENPVGQNEDIVAALLGENDEKAAYLPADCPAIKNGKLVDRWGTPWWFHPLSGKEMEIRSAGPDRDLFTADDIVQAR